MRAVVQKVAQANVKVDGNIIGEIGKGLLVLLGMQESDDEKVMEYMIDKIIHLRIFEDEEGKMNLSLKDVNGELLIVPNFTLYGDARKGKRPSYTKAAPPVVAEKLYNTFVEKAKATGIKTEQGKFQSHMEVSLLNDGPVTILIDSDKTF
ncbi:MAG: D-aminoacyl-tRNA deacylase [Epulopiscium sp.]|uniref:D-aminoacyl-tRNA deacylase n=1 Tax=Defluviitalea raffinosedens TaxID=1450156 RepID=A0A7C8LHY3_9FIRM|nr:D-aminoacyl-tRNA deacylase [Defluviitalea raffinosedens]MBZ4668816.1 D-tyrosyl-tRNA(Tyr) deacylase [Defluviitaleaceae bacterium]MDK2787055.1 D-aminoacyl-tRNA deacylase [Candidatus Epulonipiscium sp.]KAE9634442.1 D-tyrosyl-tRNA(Tyr) deacylase [Defluviitalea raffinosedens]MBM7684763.1 D-tyrosyl-tRNA(Tyr) deacylase [Defluviitalea raffinosedens]HHW66993.1 D-tyrosyl-tRNA(Tyr) deacylase [Candidatus Epulonipiscium sp.]